MELTRWKKSTDQEYSEEMLTLLSKQLAGKDFDDKNSDETASHFDLNSFWHYFLLYDSKGHIAGMTTTFMCHVTADKYICQLSQLFVSPTKQRRGLGQIMLDAVIQHY